MLKLWEMSFLTEIFSMKLKSVERLRGQKWDYLDLIKWPASRNITSNVKLEIFLKG